MPESQRLNRYSTIASHDRSPLFKRMIYHFGAIPYMMYQLHDRVPIPKEIDLIYAAQHIVSSDKRWIVDIEHAGTLSGYSDLSLVKGIILKKLHESNCKRILAWSEWSKRTITKSFEDRFVEGN